MGVGRVVAAALGFAASRDVGRRDAEVLEERAVVGAGTERPEDKVPLGRILARLLVAAGPDPRAVAVSEARACLRVVDVALDLRPDPGQRVAAAEA